MHEKRIEVDVCDFEVLVYGDENDEDWTQGFAIGLHNDGKE